MKKILVIEDDLFFQKMMHDLLKMEGYEVLTANNGKEGIQSFHDNKPELIITDIIMPEMEGTETIMELKEIAPTLKIIAVSGGSRSGFVDYLETALELGVDATFSKPFQNQALLNKIRELIG